MDHLSANVAPERPAAVPTAVCCRGLTKRFGDVLAVDRLDLDVRRGECFGLLGPNGAGKTTTVEMLEGLTKPDAGVVEIFGQPWGGRTERLLRERLGVQLQETQLPERLTVFEVLRLFRSFYRRGRDVDAVIEIVGLQSKRQGRVGKLSGGQKQRLALGCALVGDPDLLFLDEPTTGLDPQARRHVWELAASFRDGGGTILLTTHYMEEASRLCDRVAIMDQGRIIALDSPQALVAALDAMPMIEMQVDGALTADDLRRLPEIRSVLECNGGFRLGVANVATALPGLQAECARHGATICALSTHQPTLEDVFVRLTGRGLRDG